MQPEAGVQEAEQDTDPELGKYEELDSTESALLKRLYQANNPGKDLNPESYSKYFLRIFSLPFSGLE